MTATGLQLQILGGIAVSVDGTCVDFSKSLSYKGVMFSDVPNLASVFGYINASWTLKADLICAYVARLIAYMDRKGYAQVTPRNRESAMPTAAFVEHFSSGYIQRSLAQWPKQGLKSPWRVKQNYFADIINLKYAPDCKQGAGILEPLTVGDRKSRRLRSDPKPTGHRAVGVQEELRDGAGRLKLRLR